MKKKITNKKKEKITLKVIYSVKFFVLDVDILITLPECRR